MPEELQPSAGDQDPTPPSGAKQKPRNRRKPAESSPEPSQQTPAVAENEAGDLPTVEAGAALEIPEACTMEQLKEEYFPGATRLSGGVVAGLQRELRRRNRAIQKGY